MYSLPENEPKNGVVGVQFATYTCVRVRVGDPGWFLGMEGVVSQCIHCLFVGLVISYPISYGFFPLALNESLLSPCVIINLR